MPYIGKSPSAGVRQRYEYTATAGQTTFSGTDTGNLTLNYTDNNFVDVFQNGVLLKGGGTDYTATSGSSVVLTTGASVSDVVEIIVYDAFSVGNFFNRTDSDSRYALTTGATMSGALDLNGQELILDADADTSITADTDDQIDFKAGGTDIVSVTSSGVDVTGAITASSASTISVTGGSALTLKSTDAGATAAPVLFLQRDSASPADSDICGRLMFRADNDAGQEHDFIKIESVVDDVSDGSEGGSLRFFSSTNGTLAERMRINSNGHIVIGSADFSNNLSNTNSHEKIILENDGEFKMQGAAKAIATFNRNQTDGTVILIQQENTSEGSIAVSGTTVSFDGFAGRHESSGIPTDTEKGTVVSTIDELDVYPAKQGNGKKEEDCPRAGQTRADHAKVKISDSVGDKRVYGVVDSYTAHGKLMVASVGIGSIKVTGACEGGDLLESNGDGTAKVQSDDIVRSKTIGKVTIGNSSTDVKLVSCVLYCG